jgi:hypothetical protein
MEIHGGMKSDIGRIKRADAKLSALEAKFGESTTDITPEILTDLEDCLSASMEILDSSFDSQFSTGMSSELERATGKKEGKSGFGDKFGETRKAVHKMGNAQGEQRLAQLKIAVAKAESYATEKPLNEGSESSKVKHQVVTNLRTGHNAITKTVQKFEKAAQIILGKIADKGGVGKLSPQEAGVLSRLVTNPNIPNKNPLQFKLMAELSKHEKATQTKNGVLAVAEVIQEMKNGKLTGLSEGRAEVILSLVKSNGLPKSARALLLKNMHQIKAFQPKMAMHLESAILIVDTRETVNAEIKTVQEELASLREQPPADTDEARAKQKADINAKEDKLLELEYEIRDLELAEEKLNERSKGNIERSSEYGHFLQNFYGRSPSDSVAKIYHKIAALDLLQTPMPDTDGGMARKMEQLVQFELEGQIKKEGTDGKPDTFKDHQSLLGTFMRSNNHLSKIMAELVGSHLAAASLSLGEEFEGMAQFGDCFESTVNPNELPDRKPKDGGVTKEEYAFAKKQLQMFTQRAVKELPRMLEALPDTVKFALKCAKDAVAAGVREGYREAEEATSSSDKPVKLEPGAEKSFAEFAVVDFTVLRSVSPTMERAGKSAKTVSFILQKLANQASTMRQQQLAPVYEGSFAKPMMAELQQTLVKAF